MRSNDYGRRGRGRDERDLEEGGREPGAGRRPPNVRLAGSRPRASLSDEDYGGRGDPGRSGARGPRRAPRADAYGERPYDDGTYDEAPYDDGTYDEDRYDGGSGRGARRAGRAPRGRGGGTGSILGNSVLVPLALAALVAIGVLACLNIMAARGDDGAQPASETVQASGSSDAADAADDASDDAEEEDDDEEPFSLTPELLRDIDAGSSVSTFALDGGDEPVLKSAALEGIEDALSAIGGQGQVGFVFLNVGTGRGIAYQCDVPIYGASTIKAIFALYLCQLSEQGAISLSDACPGAGSKSVESVMEDMIVYSDNDAYATLRDAFSDGYPEWLQGMGITGTDLDVTMNYPTYSPRVSAMFWSEIKAYLGTGTPTAMWLRGLLASTERSFIREGLADTGASVYDKAGWYGGDEEYNSTSDAAIIELGGRVYIMSIMTDMSDSDATEALVGDLALALADAADALS